jgi:beta-glucosidase-like glycosyl hydrolase/CubicO group peptidase (beta-lactamase class C family)
MIMPFVLGDYAPEGTPSHDRIVRHIEEDQVGGVIVSVGTPTDVAVKLNDLQRHSRLPLLVAADLETGAGFRMDGAVHLPTNIRLGGATTFPPPMALGATGDAGLAYEVGRVTALEARAVGIHVPFAPVLDVNNNPDNPIINTRSFGEDAAQVSRMGRAFIRGVQEHGALATGKHFPGHGDTDTDSHLELPVIRADRVRLDTLELRPFREAVDAGLGGIMTAHIALPELTEGGELPATLSRRVLTDLLRDEMGFDGLVFTDAMDMRAIDRRYPRGEATVRAVEAGADVILMPPSIPDALEAVIDAVQSGRIAEARIDRSVRKLLRLKEEMGLHLRRQVPLEEVPRVVGIPEHRELADEIARRSVTLLRNEGDLLPLRGTRSARVLSVSLRRTNDLLAARTFDANLRSTYPRLTTEEVTRDTPAAVYDALLEQARRSNLVVVSLYVTWNSYQDEMALPDEMISFVERLAEMGRPHVVVSFGNPYLLREIPDARAYVAAWGGAAASQRAAARALFADFPVSGRTPTRLPPFFEIGDGIALEAREPVAATTTAQGGGSEPPTPSVGGAGDPPGGGALIPEWLAAARSVEETIAGAGEGEALPPGAVAATVPPERVGMAPAVLARLDATVARGVAEGVAPGAALAIGRRGRLVRLAGYGVLDPEVPIQVTRETLFDLASLTKVVGTTTAVMLLVEEGRLSLDDRVVEHLPGWDRGDSRKGAVTVRQLLLHRAGFAPFRRWYFDISGRAAYRDALYDEPLEADPGSGTVYSDLGVMSLGLVVEAVAGTTLDRFLDERVFTPLGMTDTRFTPPPSLLERIAPTERDTLWRGDKVWGRVHDENADAFGGVAGHAGLFSSVEDLAVFADFMLRGGVLPPCTPGDGSGIPCPSPRPDSVRLLAPETVARFTRRHDDASSRALGWDTPAGRSSAGDFFSSASFGHTGFTGTSLWMDPERDLFVVLLTNRVNPTRANTRHVPLRRAVHDLAAEAVTDVPAEPREGAGAAEGGDRGGGGD